MDTYRKTTSGKWWNGYDQHEAIIWDDFKPRLNIEYYLNLLDFGDFMLEIKGGFRQLHAKVIIFTTGTSVAETFEHLPDDEIAMI